MKYDYLIDVPTMMRKQLETLGLWVGYQGKPNDKEMPNTGGFIIKTVYSGSEAREIGHNFAESVPAFFQINSYFPTDSGTGFLVQAQQVAQLFKRGVELAYNNTKVKIKTCEVSGSPVTEGSFEVQAITVYFDVWICDPVN